MNKFWLGVVGSLLAVTGYAQDQADWLQRMGEAARTISYRGDFVFIRGDQMRHMRVVHLVDDQGVHQRVFSLDGPPAEILLGGGQETTSGKHQAQTDAGNLLFSTVLPQRLQALSGLYQISLGGIERVAEHQVQVVDVKPEDGYRFGFRLWSDLASGLLLRAQMRNSQGQVIEQFSFSSIDLEARGESATVTPADLPEGPKPVNNMSQLTNWLVTEMPRGFSLRSMNRYRGQHQAMVDHLLFSDGLATVSVFIEPVQGGLVLASQSINTGMVNAMTGTISDNQVTVMGEVPAATLNMIFNSLQPKKAGSAKTLDGGNLLSSAVTVDRNDHSE